MPLSDVAVDDEIRQAVASVVDSGWWSMGPQVAEFEAAFAAYTGAKHALAVANGTAALHLAFLALDIGRGDEVVLPSLNFVAAANAVVNVGARPVFCDIVGADDLNLSVEDVGAAIGPATKAVLALHYGGFPCDMDGLRQLAGEHGIVVVEDAAHAVGSTVAGQMCGTLGVIGCFSFFANKNLPIGEGGMVVTNDDEVAAKLRLLRSHGMTTLTWERHRGHAHSYDVVAAGFNYRLDEMRAALGLVQLRRLTANNEARARIAAEYRTRLDRTNGMLMPFRDLDQRIRSAHHLAVILLPDNSRDAVREVLAARRIQTSVHYPPIHTFSRYRSDNQRSLPHTDEVGKRLVTLPLYAHLATEQQELVIEALCDATP